MTRLAAPVTVLRLLFIALVASFVVALYLASSSGLGQRVPVLWAAEGGVVDVQINDGAESFVFTPSVCHTQHSPLKRCTSQIMVSNAGGEDSSSFEYSIEAWADTDGVDGSHAGMAGDELSDCFTVSVARSGTAAAAGGGASAGPIYGSSLELGGAHEWTVGVAVRPTNACQGAETVVIVAVFASNTPGYFDDLLSPPAIPSPEVSPEPDETDEPSEEETEEPAEAGETEPALDFGPALTPLLPLTVTPAATSTPGVTPTAASSPLPTPSPLPAVAPVPTTEPPTAEQQTVRVAPNFLTERIPGLGSISTSVDVIATNLTLSLIAILVILVATTVFNSTLEENPVEVDALVARVTGPATSLARTMGWIMTDPDATPSRWSIFVKPLAIVVMTALIYAALEPSFGFNASTAVLVVAMMTGIAMSTFLFEGGQVFWSTKRYRSPAVMRVYPLAIAIAAGSVVLTKFGGLHPGIVFGFVTAAAISPRAGMTRRERGMIVLMPVVGLLTVAVLAFLMIDPLRAYSEANPGLINELPETVAIALFVCGAQGALLILIPVTFNDGEKIWAWNKLVWFLAALPACFLFFHIMVNTEGDFEELSQSGSAFTLLIIAGVVLVISCLTWLYFRFRRQRRH